MESELRGRKVSMHNGFLDCINRFKILQDTKDSWSWKHSSNGAYCTKVAYAISDSVSTAGAIGVQQQVKVYKMLRKSHAPRRVQVIVWKILQQKLPTKVDLQSNHVIPNNVVIRCVFCGNDDEDISHIFFNCQFSTELWGKFHRQLKGSIVHCSSSSSHFIRHLKLLGPGKRKRILANFLNQYGMVNLKIPKRVYIQ